MLNTHNQAAQQKGKEVLLCGKRRFNDVGRAINQ